MTEQKKYVFIAGGIGITPFRSIIKDLLDSNTKLDIVLIYRVRTESEILFKNLFDQAARQIRLQVQYVVSANDQKEIEIADIVSDYQQRYFYVSGPQGFVEKHQQKLMQLSVPLEHIKTDLFTGYD